MAVAFTKLNDDFDNNTTTDSFRRRSVRYELSAIVTNMSHSDANVRYNAIRRLLTLIDDCDNPEWIIRRTIAYARTGTAADTIRPPHIGANQSSDTSRDEGDEEEDDQDESTARGSATRTIQKSAPPLETVDDRPLPPFVFHRSLSFAVTSLWTYSRRRPRTNRVYRSAVARVLTKIRRATGEAFFDHFLETYHPLVKRFLDAAEETNFADDTEYDYDETSSGGDTDAPSIRLLSPDEIDDDDGRHSRVNVSTNADDGRLQRRVTFGGEIVKIRTPDSVENDSRPRLSERRPVVEVNEPIAVANKRISIRNNNADGRPQREQFSIRADITVRVKKEAGATNGDSSGSSCSAGDGNEVDRNGDFVSTFVKNDDATLNSDDAADDKLRVRRSTTIRTVKKTSNIPLPVKPALHTPRHPRLSPTPKQLNAVLDDTPNECYSSVSACSSENEPNVDGASERSASPCTSINSSQVAQIVAKDPSHSTEVTVLNVDRTQSVIKNSNAEEIASLTTGSNKTRNNYDKFEKSIEKKSSTVNRSSCDDPGDSGCGVNLKRSLTREINVPRNTFAINTDRLRPFANVNDALNNSLNQFENHDWRIKIEALLDVISLSKYHPKELRKHIHAYTAVVSKEIKNLRSQVARAACLAARHLFVHSSEMNDRDIEQLSHPLFSRAADTNKFLRDDGNAALNSMIDNCSFSKCWLVLMKKETNQSPNALIRAAVARLTAKFTQKYGIKKIMSLNDEKKKRFLEIVVRYTTDGQMEIRNTGKQIVSLLCENQTLREYLCKIVPKRIMAAALKM